VPEEYLKSDSSACAHGPLNRLAEIPIRQDDLPSLFVTAGRCPTL
jgi:hypothetical protein